MARKVPRWMFDETRSVGVDYHSPDEVRDYDQEHERFRDYRSEAERAIERLGLGPDDTVIDMGAGTGGFALHAAARLRHVYAVDPSRAMLDEFARKADRAGVQNVSCHRGGFLTHEHEGEPVDAVVSVVVLHHLPDVWKLVGLRRVAAMLKPGGRLLLVDVVFPSETEDLEADLGAWVRSMGETAGAKMARHAEIHVGREFSTLDWIMEGLLRRAGFRIDEAEPGEAFVTTYLCTKAQEGL